MSKCETHQEGQLTSRKRPRSLIIKKNKAKRRTIYCEERGNKMATQVIPPHPPVATLGPEPANFQKNPWIYGKTGKFEAYSQVACLGGYLGGFSQNPLIS
jgi:hypothetical protein